MKRIVHGRNTFTTRVIREDTHVGLELHKEEEEGGSQIAAKVIYWDADGQFAVETFVEIPLTVLEKLIAETKHVVGM